MRARFLPEGIELLHGSFARDLIPRPPLCDLPRHLFQAQQPLLDLGDDPFFRPQRYQIILVEQRRPRPDADDRASAMPGKNV